MVDAARPPRSRRRSCGSPTASPTSTTTSTTPSGPGCSTPSELPRQPLDVLGDTHGARIDTLVIDLIDQQRGPAARSRLSPAVFAALDALRDFLFEQVYLRERRAERAGEGHRGSSGTLFSLLPRASRRDAARVPSGAGRPADPRGGLHRRHDGPVRPADVRAALPSPGLAPIDEPGSTVAGRIRQEDVEAVRERTDIVKLVSQYLTLKKAGGDRMTGLCPFHQEKTPSFSVSPGQAGLLLLRLRQGRRRLQVPARAGASGVRRGGGAAGSAGRRHAPVRGRLARGAPGRSAPDRA